IFFFQAEDGIRDRNVTGVQTCALPISISDLSWLFLQRPVLCPKRPPPPAIVCPISFRSSWRRRRPKSRAPRSGPALKPRSKSPKIGRASCREREKSTGGTGSGKEKKT